MSESTGVCDCGLWHCTAEDRAAMETFNEKLWRVVETAQGFRELAVINAENSPAAIRLDDALAAVMQLAP